MKNETTKAVAVKKDALPIDAAAMRTMIGEDLNRAEVGMFAMLRAGVGLLCYKGMSEFGEWEARLLELCPNKSTRTLQTYMQRAREFCEANGVDAESAYAELAKIDASNVSNLVLSAPTEQRQIGSGNSGSEKKNGGKEKSKAPPVPEASAQTFSQMLIDFIQQRQRGKAKEKTPLKPLTKKEKVDAAVAESNRIVNSTADWIADGTWALLPNEELESVAAGMRAAADKIKEECRKRGI